MKLLRFVVGSVLWISVGIALATVDVGQGTVVQHAEKLLEQRSPEVKGRLDELLGDQRGARARRGPAREAAPAPTEHHSTEDRRAVEALIRRSSPRP